MVSQNEISVANMAREKGLVSSEDIEECIRICKELEEKSTPKSLIELMIERNYITQEDADSLIEGQKTMATPPPPSTPSKTSIKDRDGKEDKMKDTVIGNCKIIRLLGKGGMGKVYLADHLALKKKVALKILPRSFSKDKSRVERFKREAVSAARLEHQNVVQVLNVAEEKGLHYIIMQFVEGKSLQGILREKRKLPVPQALFVIKESARALAFAHKKGVTHRDIKPDNIMIESDGSVKVADFGLARLEDEGVPALTQSGQILGTPYYMSPEQCNGLPLDGRSDIYSLGASLYYIITGKYPFTGTTPLSIAVKHISEKAPSVREYDPSIPQSVCDLIDKMMAKKPEERFQTADEIIQKIEEIEREQGWADTALPELKELKSLSQEVEKIKSMIGTGSPKKKSKALPAIVIIISAVIGAVGGGLYWKLSKKEPPKKVEPDKTKPSKPTQPTIKKPDKEKEFQKFLKSLETLSFEEKISKLENAKPNYPENIQKKIDQKIKTLKINRCKGLLGPGKDSLGKATKSDIKNAISLFNQALVFEGVIDGALKKEIEKMLMAANCKLHIIEGNEFEKDKKLEDALVSYEKAKEFIKKDTKEFKELEKKIEEINKKIADLRKPPTPWASFHRNNQNTGQSENIGVVELDPKKKYRLFKTEDSIISSPALGNDGTIYFGSQDGNLYAVTPEGKEKWKYKTDGVINSSPAIAYDGTVYFSSSDSYLYAVSSTGAFKWKFKTNEKERTKITSSPKVAQDGIIYIGSPDGLYAVTPEGKEKWHSLTKDKIIRSTPAIGEDGTIYITSEDGFLYAISPEDGRKKWEYKADAPIHSSPAIGKDGTIYFGALDKLYAISPSEKKGTLTWKFPTVGNIFSSPGVAKDGTIYIGSFDKKLYAVTPEGKKKWEHKTDGPIVYSSPSIDALATVYFGSSDKSIYALNSDGTLKWQFGTAGKVFSSPAIAKDKTIYFGSYDGHLYAIKNK